jgi:hypothetical protein
MGNAATKAHAMLQRGGDKNEEELVKLYSGSNWVEQGLMSPDKSFGKNSVLRIHHASHIENAATVSLELMYLSKKRLLI